MYICLSVNTGMPIHSLPAFANKHIGCFYGLFVEVCTLKSTGYVSLYVLYLGFGEGRKNNYNTCKEI
jgi:hypothetical protein